MTHTYESSSAALPEALDALNSAFHEFKATHDQRLESLEKNRTPDALVEAKMERLDTFMTQTQHRLDQMEAQSKRPALSHAVNAPDTGFHQYLRKGTMTDWERKKMSVSQDPQGGYLVPPSMASDVVKTLNQYPSFRPLAHTVTITSDALEMLLDKDKADVGWANEWADRPETETPEWARLRIPVYEMYARPRCTQQLLDDAQIDVESWLTQKISDTMGMVENTAFISGDGVGKPRGLITYPHADVGRGTWGHIEALKIGADELPRTPDVLVDTMHTLKPGYLAGASWIMSRSAINQVRRLKDRSEHYLWQPSLALSEPSTLLGYPVHIVDDMPAFALDKASTPIAFGNFKHAYTIVDRTGLTVLRDPYSAKPYVEFYATRRVGGDVVNFDALKLIHTTV